MDLPDLDRRLRRAGKSVASLSARQGLYMREKGRVILEIEDAENYLGNKDEVLSALNEIQSRVQRQTKELVESLLTRLIDDVMPGKGDRVVLEAGLKNNKNTLEFVVEDQQGDRENIYADRGGSIQNIISMGLRFVMLTRTNHRRFLCFDESDCWLSPRYIRPFASILNELSSKLGVQVVYISHHDVKAFDGYGRHHHMERMGEDVVVDILQDNPSTSNPIGLDGEGKENAFLGQGAGIRFIRLVNFKSHANTVLDMSEGFNVITGDNDLGKSAIVDALHVLYNNDGRESLIRHGQPEARVELGLEDGLTLQWRYRRRGAKKTRYLLMDDSANVLHQSDSGSEVPDWVTEYLAIGHYNGLDLHVSNQQSPNFLIDRSVSAHARAEALSLDADARHIQAMIRRHGERTSECRRLLNGHNKTLAQTKNRLESLAAIGEYEAAVSELEKSFDDIRKMSGTVKTLGENVASIAAIEKQLAVLDKVVEITDVRAPALMELNAIKDSGSKISGLQKRFDALTGVTKVVAPKAPTTDGSEGLGRLIADIDRHSRQLGAFGNLDKVSPAKAPEVLPVENIRLCGTKIGELDKQCQAHAKEAAEIEKQIKAQKAEKESLLTTSGACPFCHQPMGAKEHAHA